MEKKKLNPILLITAICLVTLAVLSLIVELAYPRSAMMGLTAFSRRGLNSQQFTPPQLVREVPLIMAVLEWEAEELSLALRRREGKANLIKMAKPG